MLWVFWGDYLCFFVCGIVIKAFFHFFFSIKESAFLIFLIFVLGLMVRENYSKKVKYHRARFFREQHSRQIKLTKLLILEYLTYYTKIFAFLIKGFLNSIFFFFYFPKYETFYVQIVPRDT